MFSHTVTPSKGTAMRTFAQEIYKTALIMRGNRILVCQVINLQTTDSVKVWVRNDGKVLICLLPDTDREMKVFCNIDPQDFDALRAKPAFLMVDPSQGTVEEQFIAVATLDSYDESGIGETFPLT